MSEYRRIFFSKRVLLTFLMGLFLCCVFFAYECNSTQNITLAGEELQNYIDSYPDFLQSVKDNAVDVGMLAALSDNTGFTRDNIDKTLSDYSRLDDIVVYVGENKGIVVYSNFALGDGILLAIVLVVLLQFAEEKKKGLALLVRCTKNGRSRLILERVCILGITSLVASFLLMIVCMILSQMLCGNVDFTRSLQSIPEFSLCSFPITIGQYLVVTVLLKALAALVFGVLVLFLLVWMDAIPSLLISGAILFLESLLYTLILGTEKMAGFKLANIIALLRNEIFFKHYYNINLFGHAVGFLTASVVVLSIVAVGFIVFSTVCSSRCLESGNRFTFLNRMQVWLSLRKPNLPLFFWEVRKVFIQQGGILILVAILYFAASFCLEYQYYYYTDPDREYYYKKYEGTITQDKIDEMHIDYDDNMQMFFANTDKVAYLQKYDPESEEIIPLMQTCFDISQRLKALEGIMEEAAGAFEFTMETGVETCLVKPDAYEMLFISDTNTTDKNSMFILLGIIGIFSGIMACEKEANMTLWLNTLYKGRKNLFLTKLGILVITVPILVLGVSWAQLYQVSDAVGFQNLDVIAQSIAIFREIPFPITIGAYLLLVYGLRILFALLIGLVVMGISALSSNRVLCLFICLILLAVPMVLALSGIVNMFSPADLLGFWELW